MEIDITTEQIAAIVRSIVEATLLPLVSDALAPLRDGFERLPGPAEGRIALVTLAILAGLWLLVRLIKFAFMLAVLAAAGMLAVAYLGNSS